MGAGPFVPYPGGANSILNITAATVVKAAPGAVYNVSVNVAGTAAGGVYDASTTGGNTAANLMYAINDTLGTVVPGGGSPFFNGLLIVPPTGGTVSVFFQ